MTSYELDPEAGAVILYHRGDRYYELINDRLRLVYVIHKRVKILSESALGLADVEVPFYSYSNQESVVEIKATTYNLDESGEVESQKLSKNAIYKEELNEFWSELKFSIPNVKVGSVIEYQYKIYSDDFTSMRTWYFQDQYPTIYSETNLGKPQGFNYAPTVLGEYYPMENTTETYRSLNLQDGERDVYVAKNVPAFVNVPYLRAVKNHLLRLDWKLININIPGRSFQDFNQSWEGLNTRLVENSSFKVVRTPGRIGKMVTELAIDGEQTPLDITTKLYTYIKHNYNWNGRFSMFPYPKLGGLKDEKEGNSTSLNLLLVASLRAAGVEAYPVLVSTRSHGNAQNVFPTLNQFNHSIVRVVLSEDKQMLLDLASRNTPISLLPIHDLNDLGMQLSEKGPIWVDLQPTGKVDHVSRGTFTIDGQNGNIQGELSCTDKGYAALSSRRTYHSETINEDAETYVNVSMMDDFGEFELDEFTVENENENEIGEPFKASCSYTTDEYLQRTSDRMYLKPLLHFGSEENPFKEEERKFLIDFTTSVRKKAVFTYKIPEGWTLEELPAPLKIAIPERGAMYVFQVMNMGGQLQVMSDLRINKAVFKPEMYPYLRQFLDQVIAKQGEQIVLVKE